MGWRSRCGGPTGRDGQREAAIGTDGADKIARISRLIGAAGSLAMVLWAGRGNDYVLLTALFVVWVFSPFAALAVAEARSGSWPTSVRAMLRAVTVAIAAGSLSVYLANMLRPLSAKGAFIFLVVPAASWVLGTIAIGVSALRARKSQLTGGAE